MDVRPAVVDGLFYPAEPSVLRAEIAQHLAAAARRPAATLPKLLIAPHAGLPYSGPIAAHAYALLAGAERIERVVLLGPAHRVPLRGIAAPRAVAFATPLGAVPIDAAAIAALPGVARDDRPHEREHSIEVQLPFLQVVLGRPFEIVPLVVGDAGADEVAQAIEALWGGDETLIVVSSDLSHYLPYADAQRIDRATAARIAALDGALDPYEACGARAVNGALRAARAHGLQARLLDLRNSGDTAGDRDRVVGYAAFAFDRPLQ